MSLLYMDYEKLYSEGEDSLMNSKCTTKITLIKASPPIAYRELEGRCGSYGSTNDLSEQEKLETVKSIAETRAFHMHQRENEYRTAHDISNQKYQIRVDFTDPFDSAILDKFKECIVKIDGTECQFLHVIRKITRVYTDTFNAHYEATLPFHNLSRDKYYLALDKVSKVKGVLKEASVREMKEGENPNDLHIAFAPIWNWIETDNTKYKTMSITINRVMFHQNFVMICELFHSIGLAL